MDVAVKKVEQLDPWQRLIEYLLILRAPPSSKKEKKLRKLEREARQ